MGAHDATLTPVHTPPPPGNPFEAGPILQTPRQNPKICTSDPSFRSNPSGWTPLLTFVFLFLWPSH